MEGREGGEREEDIQVVVVDGDPLATTITEILEEADEMVIEAIQEPIDGEFDTESDCIVLPVTSESPDDLLRLGRVRSNNQNIPVVVAVEDPEIPPSSVGTSGMDVVQVDAPESDLVERVRAAARPEPPDASDYQETFSALVEHSPAMISVLDEDGEYRYVSPSVEEVLGYDADELVGRDAFDLVHEEDRDQTAAEFREAVEDPESRPTSEYRHRHADGGWRVLRSWGKNRLDDPEVRGFIVSTLDVTERREYERELERQNERLDRFTSVVSHDLRSPLNVIQGYVEVAEGGGELDLDAVGRAADRIEEITTDLLTLAREGRTVGETEPVDLETLSRGAWHLVDADDATLTVEDGPGTVDADRDRLQSLLENLFRNAVEHGSTSNRPEADDAVEHGGPDVTVRLGPLPDGFYVADDGPGIPDDQRESVFEWGHSTTQAGTGFGLAIVRSIAEAHGWTVSASESESGGARFEITGVETPG